MHSPDDNALVRLVSLMAAFPEADKRNSILALAARGKVRLYVPVMPGLMAYASEPSRMAARPGSVDIRRAISLPMQRAIDEDRRKGLPVMRYPKARPEVAFLALAPKHAESLLATQSSHVHWFPGALKYATKVGCLEPVHFASELCLRPSGDAVLSGPWRGEPSEHTSAFELRHVLLDSRVPPRVEALVDASLAPADANTGMRSQSAAITPMRQRPPSNPPATPLFDHHAFDIPEDDQVLPGPVTEIEEDDPHGLRERAPGVFVLYAAAKHFFAQPGPNKVMQGDMVIWLRSERWKPLRKLLTKDNATIAFKFVNPKHIPEQGATEERKATVIDPGILDRAWKKYHRGDYVSGYLATIAYAVERWTALVDENESYGVRPTESRTLELIDDFKEDLVRWGFSARSERDAIVDFVIWPQRVVKLRAAIRPQGSR